MKKKNQRQSKKVNLKSSLLILLLTAILLIASTYAWFTSNQTVSVEKLSVNVQAKNGLQISADGSNWKSIVQTSDLTGAHEGLYKTSTNQIPSVLEPVSTAGNIDTTTGFMQMYYATIESNKSGDYIITANQSTEADGSTGKFVAYDLFLKVEKDTDIQLTTNSGATYADKDSKGLENASRVAFVVEGNTTITDSLSNIQGLHAATTATTYIWEPNYDSHKPTAVTAAALTYGLATSDNDGKQLPYAGIKKDIASTADVKMIDLANAHATNYSDYFSNVTPSYKTVKSFEENQNIFSLKAGITKVRMYMWIEGQDVDCENNASGANINFNVEVTAPNLNSAN